MKAQGAIEYLMIIGGAILIAAVIMSLLAQTGQFGKTTGHHALNVLSGSYEDLGKIQEDNGEILECETNADCADRGLNYYCINNECIYKPCLVLCNSIDDPECNDFQSETTDWCINPGTCGAECVNLLVDEIPSTCNGIAPDPPEETCENCPIDIQCPEGELCCNESCKVPFCVSDIECDDLNPNTIDNCNNPESCIAECINVEIGECINGDGVCPEGCHNENDSDCENPPECHLDSECAGYMGELCCNGFCRTPYCQTYNYCEERECFERNCVHPNGTADCSSYCDWIPIENCYGGNDSIVTVSGNHILVNGERFFPIAEWSLSSHSSNPYNELGLNGFNLFYPWSYSSTIVKEKCLNMLEKSNNNNLMFFNTKEVFTAMDSPMSWETRIEKSNAHIQTTLNCVDESPNKEAFFGWFAFDEPRWNLQNEDTLITTEILQERYDYLKSIDPNHAIITVYAFADKYGNLNNYINDLKNNYLPATDIVATDVYPYIGTGNLGCCLDPNASYCSAGKPTYCLNEATDINIVGEVVNLYVNEITMGQKPLLMSLQNWAATIPYNECRYMAFTSIINGADGVIWFGWYLVDSPAEEITWENNKKVARELNSLKEILASDTIELSGSISGNPAIDGIAKNYNGTVYLITANNSDLSIGGFIKPSVFGMTSGCIIELDPETGEQPGVNFSMGRFFENFTEWEVKVYRIEPEFCS